MTRAKKCIIFLMVSLYGTLYPVKTESEISSDTAMEAMGTSVEVSVEEGRCSVTLERENLSDLQTCKPMRQCVANAKNKSSACCERHSCKWITISTLCICVGLVAFLVVYSNFPGSI